MAELTKSELITGCKAGIHKVQKPIIGYKVVISFKNEESIITAYKTIIQLEIPIGGKIIRPENLVTYSKKITKKIKENKNWFEKKVPSKKLRANQAYFRKVILKIPIKINSMIKIP